MEPETLKETIEDMRKYIRRKMAEGFATPQEIENVAMEVFAYNKDPEVLRPIAAQLTSESVKAQLAGQMEWPTVTDCDLLDRAFGELERAGIVCRQNFTCCGT